MLTAFGKMVKKLMVDEDISQGQLAKDLGISPAMLSNYMTGKNIPEMNLVEKCIKQFNLKNEKIQEIFTRAFTSTARSNHSIHLDTRFFKAKRLELLVQAIVALMLYPEDPYSGIMSNDPGLTNFTVFLSKYLDKVTYTPPVSAEDNEVTANT